MRAQLLVFLQFILFSYTSAFAQDWQEKYDALLNSFQETDYESVLRDGPDCLIAAETEYGTQSKAYGYTLKLLSSSCYYTGNFRKGISYGNQEIKIMGSFLSTTSPEFASSLKTLAYNLQGNNEYESAMDYLKEVSNIYLVNYGEESLEYAQNNTDIGYLYYQMGTTEMSLNFLNRSLELYAVIPEGGADYLQVSFDLGDILLNEGNPEQAQQRFEEVISILEDNDLKGEAIYGLAMSGLARAFLQMNAYENAEIYYKKAVPLYEDLYGNESVELNDLLSELIRLYQSSGDLNAADSLITAYNIADAGTGTDNLDINQLINLAAQYQNKRDVDQAEEYYLRALNIINNGQGYPDWQKARLFENLAILYYDKGEFDEAENNVLLAIELYENTIGKQNNGYLASLNIMGMIMGAMGYYADAEIRYKDAIKMYESVSGLDKSHFARSLDQLGSLYLRMGRYQMAKPLLDNYLEIQSDLEGKNSAGYAGGLINLASYYRVTGNYRESERLYLEALEITGSIGDIAAVAAYENIGRLYLELGRFQKADSLLNEALNINQSQFGENSSQVANNLFDMARLRQATGDFIEAEKFYRQSLEILEERLGNKNPDYLLCLNSMGVFYQLLGNTEYAKEIYRQILNSIDRTNPQYTTVLQNLSTLYQLEGNYKMAEPLLTEALTNDSLIYGTSHPDYASSLQNLASLYQRMEEFERAEPLFVRSLKIDATNYGKDHPSYARKLYNLAVLYQDKQEFNKALPLFEEALSIRKRVLGSNHPDYAYSLYGLAVLYQTMDRYKDAYPLFNEVVVNYRRQIENIFPVLSEKEKTAFYNKIRPVFEDYKDFAIEYSVRNPEILGELFNLQLNTKAILLNSSTKVRNRILRSGDLALIDLYNKWIGLKDLLVKYYSLTIQELEEQNIDLAEVENEANDLEKELSTRSEVFASEFDKKEITWTDVQGELNPDEAVVEIIRIQKNIKNDSVIYVALILNNETVDNPELKILNKGNELEGREYKRYINTIKFTVPNEASYQIYWEPFLESIGGRNVIYISPDGIFNKMNLNTLWDQPANEYLIDVVDLKIVSNIRALLEEDDNYDLPDNEAELIGYPDYKMNKYENAFFIDEKPVNVETAIFRNGIKELPGTRVEVEKLERILSGASWNANVYLGEEALEDNIKNIANPRVLHMATHGFFLDDVELNRQTSSDLELAYRQAGQNPLLRSGLVFAGAESTLKQRAIGINNDIEGEDGILTAYEAMNLNLDNTELVVLSACETGLGEVKNGEGVYGLQRAFVVAGADHVIMSLWKVNDDITQLLMTEFYNQWLSGQDMINAFYEAQRIIKTNYPEPYYWGAFIIIGI